MSEQPLAKASPCVRSADRLMGPRWADNKLIAQNFVNRLIEVVQSGKLAHPAL